MQSAAFCGVAVPLRIAGAVLDIRNCADIATVEAVLWLKQAKPVLGAMFAWANSRNIYLMSAQARAPHYLKEQRPYLTGYLKDGRLELNNNRAERNIMHFVIDRKSFLFANIPKGAAGSAVMFSLIQTATKTAWNPTDT